MKGYNLIGNEDNSLYIEYFFHEGDVFKGEIIDLCYMPLMFYVKGYMGDIEQKQNLEYSRIYAHNVFIDC